MLRYNIRTGVKKIKTKTFMAVSGITLGVAGLTIAVAMPLAAKAATGYSLFGSATMQSDGVHLVSDSTHAYSGVGFDLPSGSTVGSLNDLETTLKKVTGNCNVGSPRYEIDTASGNIFVYLGDTPNFTNCADGSTGNLLSTSDLRVDTSQVGGTFYDTWAHAVTIAGANNVTSLSLVVDGGWAGAQEFAVSSAIVNANTYSFLPASSFQVKPWTYDPGKTRMVSSAWVTHEGIKDAGGSDHALYLTKKTATATNAASGATVTYSGQLNSLGFDYRNDGHCGAGAPRFNVYTTSGVYYFFGCAYGTHTTVPGNPGWTRVTFGNADAFPSDGTTAFPGFGNVTVTGIDVTFDEGTDQGLGFVYLDNIQVNGVLAGKPGLAQ